MPLSVLLVHQSFPSQLSAVLEALEARGDVALAGIGTNPYARPGLRYRRYMPPLIEPRGDIVLDDLAAKASFAAGAAAAARALRYDGFVPDVIVAHPGWGEALYMRDLFPKAKIVCYCEFYYMRSGGEVDFDPEFTVTTPEILHRMRARNAITLASLEDADICVAPTNWQRATFPDFLSGRMRVIHEGIEVPPAPPPRPRPAKGERRTVTFAARHLEPHRGFHIFMRALPRLLAADPTTDVVIVGSDKGGYGATPTDGRTWLEVFREEVGGLDPARLRVLGKLEPRRFHEVIGASSAHVYLTFPFVLSWSLLEAMALERPLVLSDTSPVRDFFDGGEGGKLVDFFDPAGLADAVGSLLSRPATARKMGVRAREMLFEHELTREHGRAKWLDLILSL